MKKRVNFKCPCVTKTNVVTRCMRVSGHNSSSLRAVHCDWLLHSRVAGQFTIEFMWSRRYRKLFGTTVVSGRSQVDSTLSPKEGKWLLPRIRLLLRRLLRSVLRRRLRRRLLRRRLPSASSTCPVRERGKRGALPPFFHWLSRWRVSPGSSTSNCQGESRMTSQSTPKRKPSF